MKMKGERGRDCQRIEDENERIKRKRGCHRIEDED
jgi:hypothetical protein